MLDEPGMITPSTGVRRRVCPIRTAPEAIAKSDITNRHAEGRKARKCKSENSRKRQIPGDMNIERGLCSGKNHGDSESRNDAKPSPS